MQLALWILLTLLMVTVLPHAAYSTQTGYMNYFRSVTDGKDRR